MANRTEPIRNPEHVRALLNHFKVKKQYRDYTLVAVGIFTGLRICDILRLRTSDMFDLKTGKMLESVSIIEQKTGKHLTFSLNPVVINALNLYLPKVTADVPLILNERTGNAISRQQAHRIVSEAAVEVGIPHAVSCHSLRKTFGYHCFKSEINPMVIMELFNHSSYETTRRYIGITQDDKNDVYLNLRI